MARRQVSPKKVNQRSPILDNNRSLAFNENSADIKRLMGSNGIFNRYNMQWYDRFTRIGIIDPYNALTNTKEYIFITKPDLCLMTAGGGVSPVLSNNPFFVDAISRFRHSAAQLQSSYRTSRSRSPFMTMLSNSVTSTLDIPGISADMIDTGANVHGTKISYRSTSYQSDESHDFSLEFEDDKYLDIYMIFKMWDEYEKLKWGGLLDFTKSGVDHWQQYIINKILHDQVAIYKFIVAEDGYRIVYYARIVGCVPTSIPRDAFSDTSSTEPQKLTVGWRGHFVRDMDPIIISHFNQIVSSSGLGGGDDLPLFDFETHGFNGSTWAATPYIYTTTSNGGDNGDRKEYYLRWKKATAAR